MNKDSLEQENNFLKELIRTYYLPEMAKLKIKVDKAIEYIRSEYTITDDEVYLFLTNKDDSLSKLEKILKGEDNEKNIK